MIPNFKTRYKLLLVLFLLMFCSSAYSKQKQPLILTNSVDTVPFFNHLPESYFIGNGILGAGADTLGVWNFLIGPDYTSPNFLTSETITVNINGELRTIPLVMHRIRASGIYCGIVEMDETKIHVFDFATSNKPIITRYFMIDNRSGNHSLSIGNQFAESPAYVLLLAKDYYQATKDIGFLNSLGDLLTYAINIQLENAKKADWLLPFNGDETEQYCLKADGQEYGGFPALTGFNRDQWSLSSLAACIASTDFYITYLKQKGMDYSVTDYQNALNSMKESLVKHFYRRDLGGLQWALKKGGTFYPYQVTDFILMPLWFGISLKDSIENTTIQNVLSSINPQTGFIANAPGDVEGFCGHTLAYLLSDLTQLQRSEKDAVFHTLINSCIIQRYGMVNEYYGPSGFPNPHNLRVFESGIVMDAIVKYIDTSGLKLKDKD